MQALLANIASLYAVYHGPEGLTRIADRVHGLACVLATGAARLGHNVGTAPFFDTVTVDVGNADKVIKAAIAEQVRSLMMGVFAGNWLTGMVWDLMHLLNARETLF